MSDFTEYIFESKFEDFVAASENEILVSTIHKSKGREFDYVYLIQNQHQIRDDAERRVFYVGITRAKKNLFICSNNESLNIPITVGCRYVEDTQAYPECDELIEQLGHKGVVLDYFLGKQQLISKMYSGAPLIIENDYLQCDFGKYKTRVLKFSAKTRENLTRHKENGYVPISANVRYLVYWRPTDKPETQEVLILLPEIKLGKDNKPKI